MNVQDLTNLLLGIMEEHGKEVEIRIGDQIEAGPYSHDRVGGVWESKPDGGDHCIILCAEDTNWRDVEVSSHALPVLWTPPG